MNLSDSGTHLIAQFEGYLPTPYDDSAGNATVGYGHLIHLGNVTASDRAHYHGWTTAQFLELLHTDAASAAKAVTHAVHVSLGTIATHAQARFDALCSLTYNIGAEGFATSSLLREINLKGAPRDWTPCGPLFLEWDHAGGQVVPGLLNRRRAEYAIFRTGKYPAL